MTGRAITPSSGQKEPRILGSSLIRSNKQTRVLSARPFQVCAFALTFYSYAVIHIARKTLSNAKSSIMAEWEPLIPQNVTAHHETDDATWTSKGKGLLCGPSDPCLQILGSLDTAFMVTYSFGLYISGALGDRFDPRIVLAVGMWGSGIILVLFGVISKLLAIQNFWYFMVLYVIFGLLQSTAWPCVVCVMGNWFGKNKRGLLMGIWASAAGFGNIFASLTASTILQYGYEYTFLVNAGVVFSAGFLVIFGIVSSPRDVGLGGGKDDAPATTAETGPELVEENSVTKTENVSTSVSKRKPIKFRHAVLLPGVIPYSLAYACLKMVDYSFFFWLPYYLQSQIGFSHGTSGGLSIWYDWGGVLGGLIGGALTDYLGFRSPVVSLMLVLSIGSLFGYSTGIPDILVNAVVMGFVGFFISGASNLISGCIAADLGRQSKIQGNTEALATVAGVVDGTGSVGAAIGQALLPVLKQQFGWTTVFYMFIGMAILTLGCLGPMTWRETREMIGSCRAKSDPRIARNTVDPSSSRNDLLEREDCSTTVVTRF